jgi:hypothetical protein
MTSSTSYLVFIALGIVAIAIDGRLIYRSGHSYLADVYGSPNAAAAANRLTAALFHLVTLGLLGLLSVASLGGTGVAQVVVHLGALLLVLAMVHGATMAVYSILRRRQQDARIDDQLTERNTERAHRDATHGVSPDAPAQQPYVAPTLD